MVSQTLAEADMRQVRDLILKSWRDLRRHDEAAFMAPYPPNCAVTIGDIRVSSREQLDQVYRRYHRMYVDCIPIERRLVVEPREDGASAEVDLWLTLTPRQKGPDLQVEARSEYHLQRTPDGWRIESQTFRVLRGRTFSRHGPLNFNRLSRQMREWQPSRLQAAA